MKALNLILTLFTIFQFSSVAISADDNMDKKKPPTPEEHAKIMQEYMALAQPGEMHEMMAQYVGNWNVTATMWMAPGAEPMSITGTGTTEMIIGGRFLMFESDLGEGMMAMSNMTILGFDNRHKLFNSVGLDTYGTYWVTAQGKLDETGKVLTLTGTDDDPIAGFTQVYDMIYHFNDINKLRVEVIFKNKEMTGGADSFKMAEIVFTRSE